VLIFLSISQFYFIINISIFAKILILYSMDILYITPSAAHELTNYCESDLLIEVTEHFAKNAVIIAKDNNSRPSKWWDITDYIKDDSIAYRKKMAVILSFAAIGGFVTIGNMTKMGDVEVLNMLRDTKNISDEDFDYFIDAFYNFSKGNGVKFTT